MALEPVKSLDVMVAGELYVDQIMSGFKCWPQPGQEAFAKEFYRETGGAAITARGLAKLGSRTGIFGVAGADSGPWLMDQLRQCGVDTQGICFDSSEPTGLTVAISAPEERALFTYSGANCRFPAALLDAARARQFLCSRHVHLACAPAVDTARELIGDIRANGCSVSLDTGWHEEWLGHPRVLQILRLVDIFLPNEMEARRITGEQAVESGLRCFAEAGIKRVALKLGPLGAALLWDSEVYFAGPHPVTAVDTTGAGDCFDAGFLHAWLKGESPEQCLRTANVCGALSTEARGGIAGFPSANRLHQELKGQSCAK